MFNGTYDSSDRTIDGKYWGSTGDYVDDSLIMKWSDAWLSNVDCNGDNKLDRGLVDGVVGGTSLGWLTNQNEGDYDSDGNGTQDAHYTYFAKIVWTGPGSPLWGQYTIIQEVYNDPVGGFTGLYSKLGAPGFGLNCLSTPNSNYILRSQATCFEPKKLLKILGRLPAVWRNPEAVNSYHPIWLRILDNVRLCLVEALGSSGS